MSSVAEWRIYLEAVPSTRSAPALPAGWYGGAVTTINQPIYMRTPYQQDAAVFHDSGEVVNTVRRWRDKGYPCYCVPGIEENYGR